MAPSPPRTWRSADILNRRHHAAGLYHGGQQDLHRVKHSSAEQLAWSRVYKLDAYNVGWNLTDQKRSAKWLSDELVQLWREHMFHVI